MNSVFIKRRHYFELDKSVLHNQYLNNVDFEH